MRLKLWRVKWLPNSKLENHKMSRYLIITLLLLLSFNVAADKKLTTSDVIKNSSAADWRQPKAENLLHMQLEAGEVIFEMSPEFTPEHYANLRKLVANKYFDDLAIIRSHDNYVAQWGDPNAENEKAKSIGDAKAKLDLEFFLPLKGIAFTEVESRDSYADKVGYVGGFPVASDGKQAWLTHCYGMLGVGRGMEANSGNASSLYVVTGHSPRHLDKNVVLMGRVISGIELLSSLPRGTGNLGFYEDPKQHVNIKSMRFADQLPKSERSNFEIMRTDTETFKDYIYARTHRSSDWFLDKTGKVAICNVGVPIRNKEK